MVNDEPEQAELWTAEILQLLEAEAERQKIRGDYQMMKLIQQYIVKFITAS